jgi:hypothetical protein
VTILKFLAPSPGIHNLNVIYTYDGVQVTSDLGGGSSAIPALIWTRIEPFCKKAVDGACTAIAHFVRRTVVRAKRSESQVSALPDDLLRPQHLSPTVAIGRCVPFTHNVPTLLSALSAAVRPQDITG